MAGSRLVRALASEIVDPLDLVLFLPRAVLRLIPVALLVGMLLFHAQTVRVFDDLVQYEANQQRAQLLNDFEPIIANARRTEHRELRLTRPTIPARH